MLNSVSVWNGWTDLNDPRPPGGNSTTVSTRNKQFFDLRIDPRIRGLDGAFEHGYRLPRPVEKVLVKVPARRLSRLRGELMKERVCVCANDARLREHRERDAVVHPAELRDLFVRPRLLAAEIVRRKPLPESHRAHLVVGFKP